MTLPEDSDRYTRHKAKKYHDSLDCNRITVEDQFSQWSLEYVERRDLEPCPYCHDELDRPGEGNDKHNMSFYNSLREAAEANDD